MLVKTSSTTTHARRLQAYEHRQKETVSSQCQCATCKKAHRNTEAKEHQAINQALSLLHEKGRRQFVGLLALQWGRGSIEQLSEITGLSRPTIRRGKNEVQRKEHQATQG